MASERLPGNQEDREVYLHDHRAEHFIKAVGDARRESVNTVIMTVTMAPANERGNRARDC